MNARKYTAFFSLLFSILLPWVVSAEQEGKVANDLPIFDAYIHYNHDVWDAVSPADTIRRLRELGIKRVPHHIIQRGNRRQDVFFKDSDYEHYLELLKEWCSSEQIKIWAYCLMTNHVHLIVVPNKTSNLSKAIGETHRRYTRMINFREHWKGYLWQGRFASYPMDESWLLKAAAYVEMNPVRAGMVDKPQDYRWSSIHAHLAGTDVNRIIQTKALLALTGDWAEYLKMSYAEQNGAFEKHESTGRPLGDKAFIEKAEFLLQRDLKKKKPGPKGVK